MSRVNDARNAYQNRDIEEMKKAHSEKAIIDSIHKEEHKNNFTLPEIILGGQDGLVNVLGIILGVTAATSSNQIVIVAGLAAAFAESISMAAVAYTSKVAEADFYQSELERERYEIEELPDGEREEIRQLYKKYGFEGEMLEKIVAQITSNKDVWVNVMMHDELKREPINREEILPKAVIVGISALVGSFIPLTAYFFLPNTTASWIGISLSAITLFTVGYYKAKKTIGRKFIRQGLEMMTIGMVSAFVGYIIGSLFQVKGI